MLLSDYPGHALTRRYWDQTDMFKQLMVEMYTKVWVLCSWSFGPTVQQEAASCSLG